MITLTIIALCAIIAAIVLLTLSAGFIVTFGDVIFAVAFVALIIKLIVNHRRKKKDN